MFSCSTVILADCKGKENGCALNNKNIITKGDLSMRKINRNATETPKITIESKVLITIEEACCIFSIGEHTLRKLIRSNPNANYLLHIGAKTLIKKALFQDYILKESVLCC